MYELKISCFKKAAIISSTGCVACHNHLSGLLINQRCFDQTLRWIPINGLQWVPYWRSRVHWQDFFIFRSLFSPLSCKCRLTLTSVKWVCTCPHLSWSFHSTATDDDIEGRFSVVYRISSLFWITDNGVPETIATDIIVQQHYDNISPYFNEFVERFKSQFMCIWQKQNHFAV